MPNPQHFDILVIGSGPGGEGAAMQAFKHGKQVAVVERFDSIDGGCTHWDTIPSKALRYAIDQMTVSVAPSASCWVALAGRQRRLPFRRSTDGGTK